MITTKGTIEKVEEDRLTGVIQYRVRMPLFHEIEGASPVSTNELPLAIYPTPPHMEKTILRVGDVVECSLEDANIDNAVILGLIPFSQTRNTSGSSQTNSKVVMEKVDSISFDTQGSAILPYKIKIRTDLDTDELIDGEGRNYVNGEELSYLRGLDAPVVQKLRELQETLDYLEHSLLRLEVKAEMLQEGVPV